MFSVVATFINIYHATFLSLYSEMNGMMLKLAELITEENPDAVTEVLDKFMKEMDKIFGINFWPIHEKVLSQFAATLIFHLQGTYLI